MDTALTFRHYLNQRCFSLFTTNAPNELTEKKISCLAKPEVSEFRNQTACNVDYIIN